MAKYKVTASFIVDCDDVPDAEDTGKMKELLNTAIEEDNLDDFECEEITETEESEAEETHKQLVADGEDQTSEEVDEPIAVADILPNSAE